MIHAFRPARRLARHALFALACGASAPLATVAAPATPAPAASSGLPPALAGAIAMAQSTLPRARDLNADQRKQATDLLDAAQQDDQAATDATAQIQAYRDAAERGRRDTTVPPVADAAQAFADWRARLPQDASLEQLSDLVDAERNQLGAAQDAQRANDEALQAANERPEKLRDELAAARSAADAPAPAPPTGPHALVDAATLRAQAASRLQRVHVAVLEAEQRTYELRLRALFAERSERRRDVELHEQRTHLLENMLLDRANSSVADMAAKLGAERDALVAAHAAAPLPQVASDNVDLGNDLIQTVQRVGSLRDLKNTYASERAATDQAEKNTQARIELGAVSEEVGALLLAERRKLKPLVTLNRDLSSLRSELAQTKLDLLDLREQQDGLDNLDAAIARTLTQAGLLPTLTGEVHDKLRTLLATRSDVLARLVAATSRQAQLLGDAEQQLGALTDRTKALYNLLDAHLLGTPSHAAIGLGWFGDFTHAFADMRKPHALTQGWAPRRAGLLLPLAALLALAAAVFVRVRVPALFDRVSQPMRRIRTDRYRFTMQVLIATVLAAAPIAVFWALAGRLLQRVAQGELVGTSLGIALGLIALPWYLISLLAWVTRENGLAHQHFRWLRTRREALRRSVPALTAAIILPWFVYNWLHELNNEDADGTLGRALFLLGALALAGLAWQLLRPGGVWASRAGVQNEPVRLRQGTRIALTALFVALALAAAAGYFFTAITLGEHIVLSLGALLGVAMLNGLAVRWLTLGERRLVLKRAEDRALAERAAAGEEIEGEALPDVDVDETAVADLGAQTRRVLRLLIWLSTGAALLVVWSDIAPALSFLDKYPVWQSSSVDAAGKTVSFNVTLRAVLESILILVMTVIATQNLPGLLEIGILRRLHIDAATRYAITSIVRYLIILVGGLTGIALLGVHWSNLQWLAAGLTVGLGFGLQEIFANFISGLIVLFERPYRVGDIITIGNIEGTVTRIRTRATTLIDWDNKEVFVPNKSFITERLINWTLSDSTTRLVIKVGIAYRNDARVVQKLLLDIANAHEWCLREPAPVAWMTGFGDSTQDFELRVFVAEINQRNSLRTELMMRIAEAFAEHDIELAFPQRDVWLRNAPALSDPPAAPARELEDAASRDTQVATPNVPFPEDAPTSRSTHHAGDPAGDAQRSDSAAPQKASKRD